MAAYRKRRYDSDDINLRIQDVLDREDVWEPLEGCGKPIFYWGWYWRPVNFDKPITLAYSTVNDPAGPASSRGVSPVAGFCESNKWGYPQYQLSVEQSQELTIMIEDAVDFPTETNLKAVWEFLQASIPAKAGV